MKNRRSIYLAVMALALGTTFPGAMAQRFALRPHASIGLGKAADMKTAIPMQDMKSSSNEFGLDFGYIFWQKGENALSANIGIDCRPIRFKMNAGSFSYNYAAPALADIDEQPYQRYYEISDMEEKIDVDYVNIPIYLGYEYSITKWLDVYADLGVSLGFKSKGSVKSVGGSKYAYGIYPQLDDLLIDEPYINDFGEGSLADASKGKVEARGFLGTLQTGAGLRARIYGPLWFDLGVQYNYGFSDIFKTTTGIEGAFTANNAPVTYSVAGGENIKALSDYLNKSRLSAISLNLGFTIKF